MQCKRCGRENVEPHHVNSHLCAECVKAEDNRVTYYRQHQDDWLAVAKESGLDPWTQQPGETQWEYTIWTAYRDSYPGKRPSYSIVAKELDTTYNVVRKVAQRWTFPVRMQLWMRYVDQITMAQRKEQMLSMNKTHIDLANSVNDKLKLAIAAIDPTGMKPSDISSLLKTAAELERKARIDTEAQEALQREMFVDPEQKKQKKLMNKDELGDVVQILANAGVLGSMKLTKTTTTELTMDNAIDVEAEEVADG